MSTKKNSQTKLSNANLIVTLNKFRSKATCMYTQCRAEALYQKLRRYQKAGYLTKYAMQMLSIEWSHFRDVGEGPQGLYRECNKLVKRLEEEE